MPQKSKQIVARIFLLVFALYYANICFFYHSHVINGATIVHSHFHNKAHTQNGTHGESEITLISALSAFQSLQAIVNVVLTGIFFFLPALVLPSFREITDRDLLTCIPSRAPPSFV